MQIEWPPMVPSGSISSPSTTVARMSFLLPVLYFAVLFVHLIQVDSQIIILKLNLRHFMEFNVAQLNASRHSQVNASHHSQVNASRQSSVTS